MPEVTYRPGFDVGEIRDGQTAIDYSFSMSLFSDGLGTITVTAADFATLDSPYTNHSDDGVSIRATVNHDGVPMFTNFSSAPFGNLLAQIINAKMATVSPAWTGSIAVSFSNDRYTIAHSDDEFEFTITWPESASRWLLGFAADQSTPSHSFTGTLTPTYFIRSTQGGRSDDLEGDYEPSEIASLAISDDATLYAAVSRTTSPKYRSWSQAFELKRKVFKSAIAGTERWTFEHLFEHCRCRWPFVVDDGVERMTCVFTPDGSVFRGKRRAGGPGDDVHFHVPFLVWHAGDLAGGG